MPTMVSFREEVTYAPSTSTSTLSPRPKSRAPSRPRRKPYVHQDHYLCDFYENIWKPPISLPHEREIPNSMPASRLHSKSNPKSNPKSKRHQRQQYVDISQIAYALAGPAAYRNGYQPSSQSSMNIWSVELPSDGYETEGESALIQSRAGIIVKTLRPSTVTEDSRLDDPLSGDDEEVKSSTTITSGLSRKPRPELVQASRSTSTKMVAPPLSVDMAIPPPSRMNGSVVFSTVFMKEGAWGWSIRFLLGLHEPVRHALYVMDRFLAQSQQEQDIEVLELHTREFFVWFNAYFVEYLNTQHEVKVQVLLPLIKVPFAVKQEISHSCDEVYALLAQIQAQEHGLLANPSKHERASWLLRLDLLQKSIRRLNMTVHTVLNLEEKTLNSALAEAFTEKTFRNYVLPRIFRIIKSKKVVVPWLIERSKVWGGVAEQQSIQSLLPFSAKFLYKKIWRPYFVSNVAVAMTHLDEWDDIDMAERRHDNRDAFGCTVQ